MYDMETFVPMEQFEDMLGISTIMSLLSSIPGMIVSLVVYIFTALALYTIAGRRGIKNPWLAWIPVVNLWTLGAIADDYRIRAHGKKTSRRKVLLGTSIGMAVLVIALVILCIVMAVKLIAITHPVTGELTGDVMATAGSVLIGVVVVYLALMVTAIVQLS